MGFVKLSNDLTKWAWYGDNNTLCVYVRLLLGAAWEETDYRNVHLERGQIATTVSKIAEENGISVQQTKTALDRLKATNKITIKPTNKFSIITLIDYDCAFSDNKQINQQITIKQQTNNQPTLFNTEIQKIRSTENARACKIDTSLENGFERFWNAYPKKTAKQSAFKAWQKLKPGEELTENILAALERFKKSAQWHENNGQFIPYPATWLNGRRWEDDIQTNPQVVAASSFDIEEVMAGIKNRYKTENYSTGIV